ncbi:alcohol dehydrogenase [Phyllosticta citribraziliensis]|uniref:Alcohol dehydrogenase n=1 Tax=Phyllosticta citribraziliensis TaxID=989973 RepID=A0ABR1L1Y1_9PEZI
MASNMTAMMRAVAQFGQAFNVSVVDVPVPTILDATDVIVRINMSAICGSDMHTYHFDSGSPEQPYLYGHEAIGYVTEIGDAVQFLNVGDYVVIPDNLDNGHWTIEPDVYDTQHVLSGPEGEALPGVQTEYTRIPFADNSLIPVPVNSSTSETTLMDYLFVGDIFSTAWTGVTWSGFEPGDSVAVFGAGPVGLLAAYSAILRGASRVYSVDQVQERLDLAASIGAIPINFRNSSAVDQILRMEPGGVRRSVEAVGFEAVNANGTVDSSVTLREMVQVTAPVGGMGILGVFNDSLNDFNIGGTYMKNIAIHGGIVLPLQSVAAELVPLITSGRANPSFIVSSIIGIEEAPEYYARFSRHEETKVVIRH